ncbi:hypothetical protein PanWU01x14_076360, partial [Parasponia andersonii]
IQEDESNNAEEDDAMLEEKNVEDRRTSEKEKHRKQWGYAEDPKRIKEIQEEE